MSVSKLSSCAIVFATPDIEATANFYHDKVGFRMVKHYEATEKFVALYRDAIEIVLVQAPIPYGPGWAWYELDPSLRPTASTRTDIAKSRGLLLHKVADEVIRRKAEIARIITLENGKPLAQSEGLAPTPKPAPSVPMQNSASTQPIEPLVYKSADHVPQPAAEATPAASAGAAKPAAKKKSSFFGGIGKFFRHIFGAE